MNAASDETLVYPDFSDPYQQELLFLLNLFDLRVVMGKDLAD